MTPVEGLSDAVIKEVDLWLSADELTAIVTLGGPQQTSHLAHASRASVTDPFVLGPELTALNARSTTVGHASMSPDGLTLYYEAYYASTSYDVERATRTSLAEPFANPAAVPELNGSGPYVDRAPTLDATGDHLYWASTQSGDHDVSAADLAAGTWVNPHAVYQMAARYERFFVLADEQRALYFGSSTDGLGSFEIRVVSRDAIDVPFGSPVLIRLPQVVPSAAPAWLSPDHCALYLSAGGDIWLATRVPE
jgi:hypothetical protein